MAECHFKNIITASLSYKYFKKWITVSFVPNYNAGECQKHGQICQKKSFFLVWDSVNLKICTLT